MKPSNKIGKMKLGPVIKSVGLHSTLHQSCPGPLNITAPLISMFPTDSKFIKLTREAKWVQETMERPKDQLNETLYIIHGGFHQNSIKQSCFNKLSKSFITRKLKKMRQLSVLIYDKVFKSIVAGFAVLQMLSKDTAPTLHRTLTH